MQSKNTPGPWAIMDGRPSIVRMPEKADIGHGHKYAAIGGGNNEANARLIAAAPEMLEALNLIVENWRFLDSDEYKVAMAAIAKAEGSENAG